MYLEKKGGGEVIVDQSRPPGHLPSTNSQPALQWEEESSFGAVEGGGGVIVA